MKGFSSKAISSKLQAASQKRCSLQLIACSLEPFSHQTLEIYSDNFLHKHVLRHLPSQTQLLLADSGFDDQHLANACDRRKVTLVTPILKVGKSSPNKRLARAALFATPDVREAFVLRKTSVEPFQGQLKDVFGLERLPVKGLLNVRALCVLAVVTYCLLVLFNVKLGRNARAIKETMYLLA